MLKYIDIWLKQNGGLLNYFDIIYYRHKISVTTPAFCFIVVVCMDTACKAYQVLKQDSKGNGIARKDNFWTAWILACDTELLQSNKY